MSKRITISLSEEAYERYKELAKEDHRTTANYISYVLESFLKIKDVKARKI